MLSLTALVFIYPQLAPLLTFWTSLSTEALVCFGVGAALVTISFASATFLPSVAGRVSPFRRILFALGVVLLVTAGIWQTAIGIGVHREREAQLQLIAEAQRIRAEKAEAIHAADQARRKADETAHALIDSRKKEFERALAQDPNGGRIALPRADAIRLHDFVRGVAR